jgi:hypothetical protein
MPKPNLVGGTLVLIALLTAPCTAADDFKPETIIALERAAIDRWGKGDPQGFLETMPRTFPTLIRRRSTASMGLRR